MIKNIIIAALAAGYALRCPWFAVCDVASKAVIWLTLAICLLFFCFFCDEKRENRLKKQERARKLQEQVIKLRYEGGREHAGNDRSGTEASRG